MAAQYSISGPATLHSSAGAAAMDPRTVRLDEESLLYAFSASGYNTMAEFLSSLALRQGVFVRRVELLPSTASAAATSSPDSLAHPQRRTLRISVPDLRHHQESKEHGSFVRLLRDLPTSLGPFCTSLHLCCPLESMEELKALCDGLASPLCSLSDLRLLKVLKINADQDNSIKHDSVECTQLQKESTAQSHEIDADQDNGQHDSVDSICKQMQKESAMAGPSTTAELVLQNALLDNTSLQSLSVCMDDESAINWEAILFPLLLRSPCPITKLGVSPAFDCTSDCPHLDGLVHRILAGLDNNTITLESFRIGYTYIDFAPHSLSLLKDSTQRLLATMLESNVSLKTLDIHCINLPGSVIERLFTSLLKNAYLTSLSLWGCGGSDWPSASSVLTSLQTNAIINNLDLRGTSLQSQTEHAIKVQLARNQKNLEQLKVLKVHGRGQVRPSTIRLFLVGLPYSGKTTLSRSLVKWNSPKSASSFVIGCLSFRKLTKIPERTRGIELSTLDKHGVKVSLWDMAGQEEYYAFHDYMFPDLSNESTPSLFLFVWNPIQIDKSTGQELKDGKGNNMIKTLDTFEQEFRYWLRFIVSKTLKSFRFRPRLLVAVTRGDLLEIDIKLWLKNTFNRCQKDFQEYIQFDMEGLFQMDARDSSQVRTLALTILDEARAVLNSVRLVYKACDEARTKIVNLVVTNRFAPMITKEEFSLLCKRHLGIDTEEMEEAVALSLTDSGDLIYFKSLDLVVINTQWFCHEIMGDLLQFGDKRFQRQGFFSLEFLQSMLESKINSKAGHMTSHSKDPNRSGYAKQTSSPKIEGKALVKLLIGLRLACQQDDCREDSDIFIPASLCARSSRHHLLPGLFLKGNEESTLLFMGRRLKCKNSICTFFTPGIFPLLQVTFKNILTTAETILEEDIIAFSRDGFKIVIEFCKHEGQDHFIDILAHSHLDLDETIGWVYEEVIGYVEEVCAEPRGIQGVELVHEVIRPRCVREAASMEERRNAAVPMDTLRNALSYHFERKGPKLDRLRSVFHSWQTAHDADLVVDLLGTEETLKVAREYTHKLIADVENVLGIEMEKEGCSSTSTDQRVLFSPSMPEIERDQMIYDGVQEVRRSMQVLHKDIHKMHKDMQKIGEYMQTQCGYLLPRMQALLTYFKEKEMARLPRMFLITKSDGGRMRKIVCAMIPGLRDVHLELLCEHHSQPHLVEDQLGLNFATMENALLKKGFFYVSMFLKVAEVATKVGAASLTHANLGDAIPDFTRILASVLSTPELPTAHQSDPHIARSDFQKGQRWLLDVLSQQDCCTNERIHEVFGLSRVQYGNSHVGWLCDTHSSEGELCPV